MIQATARILRNVVELSVGDRHWIARPIQAEQEGLGKRIAALFSTEYHVFGDARAETPEATVSYRAKSDEIRIRVGEDAWRTASTVFGPMTIEYGGRRLTITERLTGRFAISDGGSPAGVGRLGFRSCAIDEYPAELETFLGNLALGYVLRTLPWEMHG